MTKQAKQKPANITPVSLDIARGAGNYVEARDSLLEKITKHIKENKIQATPPMYLEMILRQMPSMMENIVPEIDVREAAIIFGTVVGTELGSFLAKDEINDVQVQEIGEAFYFAMRDTAERVADYMKSKTN